MTCPKCGGLEAHGGSCWTRGCSEYVRNRQQPAPRKPLRKKSGRKRNEESETHKIRQVRNEQCELCEDDASETHEICGGSHRHRAVYFRAAQLRLCRACHSLAQGEGYARQIARAMLAKVNAVNHCHGSVAVQVEDVIEEVGKL